MDPKSTSLSTWIVVGILALVGMANLGYAMYKISEGHDTPIALLVAGMVTMTMAAILRARSTKK